MILIASAVHVLEKVHTQFPFLYLQLWGICFLVSLAVPSELLIVFRFVGTIALEAFCPLDFA